MIIFAYQSGHSLFHRMNTLTRLLLFMILLGSLNLWPWTYQLGLSLTLILIHIISRVNLFLGWRNVIFFMILAALIFWGDARQDLYLQGAILTWRYLLILYSGLLFTALTDPMELGESLYRLTRPIPFFPAGRLMLLVSLTMTILPLLQQENRQLSDALKSRGLAKHPSPFRRLYYHSQPLINGVMRLSDKIAQALYSRCLNKNPTLLGPDLTMGDYLLITAAFLFLGLGLYLKYYILR